MWVSRKEWKSLQHDVLDLQMSIDDLRGRLNSQGIAVRSVNVVGNCKPPETIPLYKAIEMLAEHIGVEFSRNYEPNPPKYILKA